MKLHFLAALLCAALVAAPAHAQDFRDRITQLELVNQQRQTPARPDVAALAAELTALKAELAALKAKPAAKVVCPVLGGDKCPGSCECQNGGLCTCLAAKAVPATIEWTVNCTDGSTWEVKAATKEEAIAKVNAHLRRLFAKSRAQTYQSPQVTTQTQYALPQNCGPTG